VQLRLTQHLAKEVGATALAAAFYDYETETTWSSHGDRWFHAASTIKVAVLLALFRAIEAGRVARDSRVHVRNRFVSVADGETYRIVAGRDANSEVFAAIGRTMSVDELARHMIATSSNLATNLLVDAIGLEWARTTLDEIGLEGVRLVRGVEDDAAFRAGISNRVTANGLVRLLRAIYDAEGVTEESSRAMIDILLQQEFKTGIPAGVPTSVRSHARFAHKTGEISTAAHDAGLVFLPNRKPYAIAVLTEWEPDTSGHQEAVAKLSRAVYSYLTHRGPGEKEAAHE
jgi:beta-lactamase class A